MSKLYGAWGFAGIIVMDEKGKIIRMHIFREKEEEVGRKLWLLSQGEEIDEKKEMEKLGDIVWEGLKGEFPNIAGEYLRKNSEKILIKEGIVSSRDEYIRRVLKINLHYLQRKYENEVREDRVIVSLGSSIETLTKAFNEIVMRVRELFSYYLPNFYESFSSNEEFIDAVMKSKYKEFKVGDIRLEAKFKEEDLREVINLAKLAKHIQEKRDNLRKYIFERVRELMPNTTSLVGEEVAYKLLEEAGSLEALARAPSSTIQVLGAEKSLFLHLRGKGKSPKHGVIFLSDFIQSVDKKYRGKVSRTLALKISLSAKKDYFGKGKDNETGKKLRKEMEEFISKLK